MLVVRDRTRRAMAFHRCSNFSFRRLPGYIILCSTGCDSMSLPTDPSQWSDVVAFQNGPNSDRPSSRYSWRHSLKIFWLQCYRAKLLLLRMSGTEWYASVVSLVEFQNRESELTVYIGQNRPKAAFTTAEALWVAVARIPSTSLVRRRPNRNHGASSSWGSQRSHYPWVAA